MIPCWSWCFEFIVLIWLFIFFHVHYSLRFDGATYLSLFFNFTLSLRLSNNLWGLDALLFFEFINIVFIFVLFFYWINYIAIFFFSNFFCLIHLWESDALLFLEFTNIVFIFVLFFYWIHYIAITFFNNSFCLIQRIYDLSDFTEHIFSWVPCFYLCKSYW